MSAAFPDTRVYPLSLASCQQPIDFSKMADVDILKNLKFMDYKDHERTKTSIGLVLGYLKLAGKEEAEYTKYPCSIYLEGFIELLEQLPMDIQRNFSITSETLNEGGETCRVIRLFVCSAEDASIIVEFKIPKDKSSETTLFEDTKCNDFIRSIYRLTQRQQCGTPAHQKLRNVTVRLKYHSPEVPSTIDSHSSSASASLAITKTSALQDKSDYFSFPDTVAFDKSQTEGSTDIGFYEGVNNVLTRPENYHGNAIGLINSVVYLPGEYTFLFIVERDQGASCCIGVVPNVDLTLSALELIDAVNRAGNNIYASSKVHCIRSFHGRVYQNGKEAKGIKVDKFWEQGTSVEMKITVTKNKADIWFTVDNRPQLCDKAHPNGQPVFSNVSVPLRPLVGFYAGMEKKITLLHGEFTAPQLESPEVHRPQHPTIMTEIQRLSMSDYSWPEIVGFCPKYIVGNITVAKNLSGSYVERASSENNVALCCLNCICNAPGTYEFKFDFTDEGNGTCVGFFENTREQIIKDLVKPEDIDSMLGNHNLCVLRFSDATCFDRNMKPEQLSKVSHINPATAKLVFEVQVKSDRSSDIILHLTSRTNSDEKFLISTDMKRLTPFVAYFGKGKQTSKLKAASYTPLNN
ncbi:hypothetical protein JQC92_05940 [Shewanella sp. 202IG2-18]|uniref:hypothetical protein n=1 Tax=Parashewanella hymeniacidonis TaxID=2807618 RepID=UPI00195F3A1B|nr:hypothetical protein [Parashewanella hymeniacidonis]MBM7071581.1 hypothetical protein [Parashewanella hymeniacidonis]